MGYSNYPPSSGGGGGSTMLDETMSEGLTTSGSDTVVHTFASAPTGTMVFRNGVQQIEGDHYSVSGTSLTWLASRDGVPDLEPNDVVNIYSWT